MFLGATDFFGLETLDPTSFVLIYRNLGFLPKCLDFLNHLQIRFLSRNQWILGFQFLLVLTLLIQILNLIASKLLSLRGELLQTLCITPNFNTNPFDDNDDGRREASSSSSSYSGSAVARDRYKNDFHGSGGLQNQSVQELENYAVYKAEETTKTVNSCLKIAEDIREDATRSLVMLHQQGEQITRTHMMAADTERD